MTDPHPIGDAPLDYSVSVEHFDALDDEFATFMMNVLNDAGLASTLVAGVLQQLPDPVQWRITISGDMVATINQIEQREEGNAYTLERGVGSVGARTISAHDGTYDIVLGAWSFMPPFEVSSPEELLDFMHKIGLHLAIHESGHAILHQRNEDSDAYQELVAGTLNERAWRKHLAAHVDDFRIEKMANRTAPSPTSRADDVGDAIAHMRRELTEANGLRQTDGEGAAFQSSTAVNDLVRVMTYLAAELGAGGQIVRGMRPDPLADGWAEYLEEVWDAWALNLDRLKPADVPMAEDEIAAVLGDLCRIVVTWSRAIIGYHFELHEDGSWTAEWTRATY